MKADFVHLHVHTEYSLVDGLLRVGSLLDNVRQDGMPAVAVTDESNLFALVKFYRKAEAAGIKPIIGSDLWFAHPDASSEPFLLSLLVRNREGYAQLCRLLSRAYIEGYRGERPVVDCSWLHREECSGLIAMSGLHSDLGQALQRGNEAQARARLPFWQQLFDDRLYLEITRTGRSGEQAQLAGALHLGQQYSLPVLASNDVRFLHEEDFRAHEARVCIHEGRVLNDPKRPRNYTEQQYLKSTAEMLELFADLPGALENSVELAQRCSLEMRLGEYFLPAFPVPEEHDLNSFLRAESHRGLDERLATHGVSEGFDETDYRERLDIELDVIIQMGFPGYFLIVADFIRWAKKHDIPVGPGRGSGAGSLVAWCLEITDLDPIRFDLLFERFLNPERVSMPDFDIDFCMERRDEVIGYVRTAYGADRVSQIITYGSMAAKAVIRDTGRVLGMSYGQVDSIAKLIPMTLGIELAEAMKQEAELRERYEKEEEVATLINLALKLEGITRNAGKHAGGVVIAPSALTDFAPLFCEPEAPRKGDAGVDARSMVTQFDKDDVESVGLVKFDFLGLRTLTIIKWAVDALNERRNRAAEAPINITALPIDDSATYTLLKSCRTTAVFQLESRGMKELIRKLQPDSFEEIIALVALFRPGPLQSGMVDDFIARKHGHAEVNYPHPLLEPILKPTYGVIVYQEQVMQIAQTLAGYSLGGADLLRRAMGKKKPEEMAKQRQIFLDGARDQQVDENVASAIFDLMEKFAEYGFNKSHSAAYALVSYQTAWLKAHYPAEFMAAVLSSDMDSTDKVVVFFDECRAMDIEVQPPDINHSVFHFRADAAGVNIRYGLGAIKGVGEGVIRHIVDSRTQEGPYRDLLSFCSRMAPARVNRRVMEALIQAGALDCLGCNRATLLHQLPDAMKAAEQHLRDLSVGQNDMFGSGPQAPAALQLEQRDELPLEVLLQGERATLGLFLSGHPVDAWERWLQPLTTCPLGSAAEHYQEPAGERRGGRSPETPVTVAGLVTGLRKRGDNMAFVQIEDRSGRLEVAFYREAYSNYAALLVRDAVLVIDGGLLIDDFNGGFQLRARTVYSVDQACAHFAQTLLMEVSSPPLDFPARLRKQLEPCRGGTTPVRLRLRLGQARVDLELADAWRMRVEPDLVQRLETLPGVERLNVRFARPAAANGANGNQH